MPMISTSYPSGSMQTETEGIGLPGGSDLSPLLYELIKRKLQQPVTASPAAPRPMASSRETPWEPPVQEDLRSRNHQFKPYDFSRSGAGAMVKPTYVGGHWAGYQPDFDQMNPEQRRRWSPAGSGFEPGGADTLEDQEGLREREFGRELEAREEARERAQQDEMARMRYGAQLGAIYGFSGRR